MAEKKDDIEIVEEGGGKKTKLLIIVGIVLLLVIAAAVAFFMMGDEGGDAVDESEQTTVRQSPIYFAIDAPFIINFSEQSNNAVRYMQVKMKVMARNQAVIDAVQLHLPAIQHEVLMLLYSQNYDELLTTEGTKVLQQACLEKINAVVKSEETMEDELEAVYFTSFIMQ